MGELLTVGIAFEPWEVDVAIQTDTRFRNGSVESIKKIIGYLNDANLDSNTG